MLFRIILLFLLPSAAIAEERTSIAQLAWLKGCWQTEGKDRVTIEQWMAPAGDLMLGMSRTISGGRAVEFEFMQIRQLENGEVVFIARPSGQPEATFKLVKADEREVIFENPAHDFPQRVIYRSESKDALVGRIEGKMDGEERAVSFPMRRIGCAE